MRVEGTVFLKSRSLQSNRIPLTAVASVRLAHHADQNLVNLGSLIPVFIVQMLRLFQGFIPRIMLGFVYHWFLKKNLSDLG